MAEGGRAQTREKLKKPKNNPVLSIDLSQEKKVVNMSGFVQTPVDGRCISLTTLSPVASTCGVFHVT